MKTVLDYWQDAQSDPLYWAETAKNEFAIDIYNHMEEMGINKSDLAQKVGVSKQYISKVLGGEANLSIETMSKLLFAVGRKVNMESLSLAAEISEGDASPTVRHRRPRSQSGAGGRKPRVGRAKRLENVP